MYMHTHIYIHTNYTHTHIYVYIYYMVFPQKGTQEVTHCWKVEDTKSLL